MSTISKSLSTKTDANGYTQVLFLVRNGRKSRLRIKSGVFVPEKYWNEKKQTISIPKKIGVAIADELQVLRDRVELNEKRVLRLIEIYEEKADKQFIESALFLLKEWAKQQKRNAETTDTIYLISQRIFLYIIQFPPRDKDYTAPFLEQWRGISYIASISRKMAFVGIWKKPRKRIY